MTPFVLFSIQTTFSLVLFSLIAAWYVVPSLKGRTVESALVPLLLVHAFRYTPLTLLVPGQVSPDVPANVARVIAYGDLLSAVLAVLALLLLRYGVSGALGMVWLFTVVGTADIAAAIVHGMMGHLYDYELGFNWYILNYYVPALIVTHVLIIGKLLERADRATGRLDAAG